MHTSSTVHPAGASGDAPLTLSVPPPRSLGLRETTGLWASLGISLLLPVAATFVVLADRPLWHTIGAIVVGAVIGSVLLGLGAAVSAQNVVARLGRRLLAGGVGVLATTLALAFDLAAYEPFLFLIGAVSVPLVGVFVVAYYLLPRGAWDVSDTARARPLLLLLPWAAGFVAYQLALPTFFSGPGASWTSWWAGRQADLGIDPANGWSASLVSLAVAAVLTLVVALPGVVRRRRGAGAA